MSRLRYHMESNGYTVMDGDRFIGRVSRSSSTYHYSNGRIYRSWSWNAYPVGGLGTHGWKSRAQAARQLIPRTHGKTGGRGVVTDLECEPAAARETPAGKDSA